MFGAGLSKAVLRPRIALVIGLAVLSGTVWGQTVTIDGSQTNQFIEGFGVNANYFAWSNDDLKPALDALIDQAGMTLFRVIFNNGWEATNDNSDAEVMNWDYYNALYSNPEFEKLWSLLAYLNQKGITNGIVLNFQGLGPDWMGGFDLTDGYEEEWAEMVTSLVVYARNTRHLQFNLVAPHNESDIGGEGIYIPTADQYVTTLHKLAQQLDTNGLSDIRFVAPDLSMTDTDLLGAIMEDDLVMSKLAHFGLHSYGGGGGNSEGVYDFIQESAYPDRTFWMTEFNVWCANCEAGISGTNDWDYCLGTADYLMGHLANRASAGMVWEGYDSYYPHHANWSFWGLLAVDDKNALAKTYTPRKNFYTLAQIAKFVRPGARSIGLSGYTGNGELLAFYHDDSGQLTLVGINPDSSPTILSGVLQSLPPIASLALYYTDSNTNLYHSAVLPVTNGAFSVSVPPDCIFTLTGLDPAKLAVSLQITNPVEGMHFSTPADILIQATASTTTGSLSKVEFLNNGSKIGESLEAPYSMVWSNVPPGTYTLSARATNSEGDFGVSSGVHAVVIGPLAQIHVTPADIVTAPLGTQQFSASATDALGSALDPQPPFTWSASVGGNINSNGMFTAGASIGGPFVVLASSDTLSGTASVLVSTNAATSGTGYTWYGLASPGLNSPRVAAPGLNDGNLATDVHLRPTGEDIANVYEAAGIVWAATQSVSRVVYVNGSLNSIFDGVFAGDFRLQFSTNGVNWNDAGPEWTLIPPYQYNSASSAFATYTFSGGVARVRGVRCAGLVHTSGAAFPPNSWVAFATEVQVFVGVESLPLLRASAGTSNGIVISWPITASPYVLESSPILGLGATWSSITNTPQQTGAEQQVTLGASEAQRFFRLRRL